MSDELREQVTQILQGADADGQASQRLLPLVYSELRAIARDQLRHERPGHTLQATALVHEAYVRLIASDSLPWQNRSHFFGACGNAMRQILIEHARRRLASKRGGQRQREPLTDAPIASSDDPDLVLAVAECMDRLREEDPRAAEVVNLRFFAGLEMSEIALALDLSERTVHREWSFARARLQQMMSDEPDC